MIEEAEYNSVTYSRVDTLRRRINDDNYLHAAIQRLALVLSKELMDISSYQRYGASSMRKAGVNEQQRERRK